MIEVKAIVTKNKSDVIATTLNSLPKDEKYKQFQEKLVCSNYNLEGVRVGEQKRLAKELAKQLSLNDLVGFVPNSFEQLTVFGLVICYHKSDICHKVNLIDYFISLNDNWASNDIVTAALKDKSDVYFDYLLKLSKKGGWNTRFAVTAMLTNFADEKHLASIFDMLFAIEYGEYYVDMAVSWLLSKLYINYGKEVIEFCKKAPLSKFVLKKTASKIRDSFCISKEDKDKIKQIVEDILCTREIC